MKDMLGKEVKLYDLVAAVNDDEQLIIGIVQYLHNHLLGTVEIIEFNRSGTLTDYLELHYTNSVIVIGKDSVTDTIWNNRQEFIDGKV